MPPWARTAARILVALAWCASAIGLVAVAAAGSGAGTLEEGLRGTRPGRALRVQTILARSEGRFVSVDADTLRLELGPRLAKQTPLFGEFDAPPAAGPTRRAIPADSITGAWTQGGASVRGAAIGMLAGALLGRVLGEIVPHGEVDTPTMGMLAGIPVGGVVGLVAGGSIWRRRWP